MFKPIPDYPNYSINEKGELMNNTTKKILKPRTSGRNGSYYCYGLVNGIKNTNKYAHRLVAEAFIPNPNNLPIVDHIDGNKKNNNVSNLRWVTNYQNLKNYGFDKLTKYSVDSVGVGVIATKGDEKIKFKTKSDLLRYFGYNTVRTRVKIGEPYSYGKLKGYTIYYL